MADVTQGDVLDAYKVVYLATYFRVSYPTTLKRLLTEHHIDGAAYERRRRYSPQALAERVGLDARHFREADPHPLGLERYPVSVLKKVRWALREDRLSLEQAATLLGASAQTVQARLLAEPPPASARELREFNEMPY